VKYLLDSDVLINAKNFHYGMGFCPAFWDWLIDRNKAGVVTSIQPVFDEIQGSDDELAEWAKGKGAALFKQEADTATFEQVLEWTRLALPQRRPYEQGAVSKFLSGADAFLVAHALMHKLVVVTHETPSDSFAKLKIPNACLGVDVKWMSPFQMLRIEKARFVLDRNVAKS
jgi:hypothetical protein